MNENSTYYTHNNGERSFKIVVFCENGIAIYNNYKNILVLRDRFDEIYIGESPKCQFTEESSGYGDDFLGNSIVYIKDNICTFIGRTMVYRIYFEKEEKVLHYVSMVGNNDVPYPYLITNKYIYFMENRIMIQTKHEADISSCYKECLYTKYCNNNAYSSLTENMNIREVVYHIKW